MRGVVEEGPEMAVGFASGGFDLDDVGPEIAQKLAAELTGFIGELEDSEAGQRARQRLPLGILHCSISSR